MSKKVIYFDGGGSGIRAGANIDGTKSEAKNFAGFSHGEVDLVDYLADVVSKYANEIGGDISRAVLATATLPADAALAPQEFGQLPESTKIHQIRALRQGPELGALVRQHLPN